MARIHIVNRMVGTDMMPGDVIEVLPDDWPYPAKSGGTRDGFLAAHPYLSIIEVPTASVEDLERASEALYRPLLRDEVPSQQIWDEMDDPDQIVYLGRRWHARVQENVDTFGAHLTQRQRTALRNKMNKLDVDHTCTLSKFQLRNLFKDRCEDRPETMEYADTIDRPKADRKNAERDAYEGKIRTRNP